MVARPSPRLSWPSWCPSFETSQRPSGAASCAKSRWDRKPATSPEGRGPGADRSRAFAVWAESVAADYLRRRGLQILDRNWRSGRRELDIVARDGDVVAFVEVKARSAGPQDPLEAIGRVKRRDLRRAAEHWIHSHPGVGREFRFDAIGIRATEGRTGIRYVRHAFTGDDT